MSMLGRASDQKAHDAQVMRQFLDAIIEIYGISEFTSNKEILKVVLDSKLELDRLRGEKIPEPHDLDREINMAQFMENASSDELTAFNRDGFCTSRPPNEEWVEVPHPSGSPIIKAMAFYGRDGVLTHWKTEDGSCHSMSTFTAWRRIRQPKLPDDSQEATKEPIMQFFAYRHLPENLQSVSKPFCELATTIVATLPRNPERTVALRKLLEAKDAAVRALLSK